MSFSPSSSTAWYTALSFLLLSTLLTIIQIRRHLRYNRHPSIRKYVIRIILMVPIYSLESWLGLRFVDTAMYFDVLRECYEAFVIYSFFQLLFIYLGGEDNVMILVEGKEDIKHPRPFCWILNTWKMIERDEGEEERRKRIEERKREEKERNDIINNDNNNNIITEKNDGKNDNKNNNILPLPSQHASTSSTRFVVHRSISPSPSPIPSLSPQSPSSPLSPSLSPSSPASSSSSSSSPFLFHCQLGTFQYCLIRPLTAVFAFLFSLGNVYCDGEFRPDCGYAYLSLIVNFSQLWAMYCLVMFYTGMKKELAIINPIPKFLVVKAVVFFTFWQYVLLAILEKVGVIHSTDNYSESHLTAAIQDFCVCCEMTLAAVSHHYVFGVNDFNGDNMENNNKDKQSHNVPSPLIAQPMIQSIWQAMDMRDVYVDDVRKMREKVKKRKEKGKGSSASESGSEGEELKNNLNSSTTSSTSIDISESNDSLKDGSTVNNSNDIDLSYFKRKTAATTSSSSSSSSSTAVGGDMSKPLMDDVDRDTEIEEEEYEDDRQDEDQKSKNHQNKSKNDHLTLNLFDPLGISKH